MNDEYIKQIAELQNRWVRLKCFTR